MAYLVLIVLARVGVSASDVISFILHFQDDWDAEIEAAAAMHGKACACHCDAHIFQCVPPWHVLKLMYRPILRARADLRWSFVRTSVSVLSYRHTATGAMHGRRTAPAFLYDVVVS
jgi:hypothetical protein